MILNSIFAIFLALLATSEAVELTVTNNCDQTLWMATTPNYQIDPLPDGVVTLVPAQTYTYAIPEQGWAGRFWPKVGCDETGYNCEFGDSSPPCGPCQPPADTKVEFNFAPQPATTESWYDISLVDGYSLPMRITPRGISQNNCIETTCQLSLDRCPKDENNVGDLGIYGTDGKILACLSPCKKWNYPPPYGLGNDEQVSPGVDYCCPTPPIYPEECSSGPVIETQYVQLIHETCPTAYSYAYDDFAGLHNCPGETSFDVVMCP